MIILVCKKCNSSRLKTQGGSMFCKDCGSFLNLSDTHFVETPDHFGIIKNDSNNRVDFHKSEEEYISNEPKID